MGGMLTQPVTEKSSKQGEGLGLRYGMSSMQGWRPEMEDAHDVKLGLNYGLDDWSYFAVFDGHAGKCAAAYAAWNLLEFILRDSQFELETKDWSGPINVGPNGETLNDSSVVTGDNSVSSPNPSNGDERTSESETHAMNSVDQTQPSEPSELPERPTQDPSEIKKDFNEESSSEVTNPNNDQDDFKAPKAKFASFPILKQLDMVKNAIKSGFLKIDQSMRTSSQDMSGCTAVCTLISPSHLFIANCGDSRAVLYDGVFPKFVTEDHKPFNPKERKRIIDAGGTATQRINGTLAVSRALGDFEFKKDLHRGPCEQLVSPEPEVTVIERHPYDEFLILACDGIWDVMTNDDLCLFVRYKLWVEPSLEKICSSVLDVCLRKGSRDNMSIIIVVFGTESKLQKWQIDQDKENDEIILRHVDSVQEKLSIMSFPTFFGCLQSELEKETSCPGGLLPPGAGIEAKYDMIHERWEKNLEKFPIPEVKEEQE